MLIPCTLALKFLIKTNRSFADFAGLSELGVRGAIVTRHPILGRNKSKIFASPPL
jgi:hypothetical protein